MGDSATMDEGPAGSGLLGYIIILQYAISTVLHVQYILLASPTSVSHIFSTAYSNWK